MSFRGGGTPVITRLFLRGRGVWCGVTCTLYFNTDNLEV